MHCGQLDQDVQVIDSQYLQYPLGVHVPSDVDSGAI